MSRLKNQHDYVEPEAQFSQIYSCTNEADLTTLIYRWLCLFAGQLRLNETHTYYSYYKVNSSSVFSCENDRSSTSELKITNVKILQLFTLCYYATVIRQNNQCTQLPFNESPARVIVIDLCSRADQS